MRDIRWLCVCLRVCVATNFTVIRTDLETLFTIDSNVKYSNESLSLHANFDFIQFCLNFSHFFEFFLAKFKAVYFH